jgi:acyl-CoA dehydrogenase
MDFAPDPETAQLRADLEDFVTHSVIPAEPVHRAQARAGGQPAIMEDLKAEARERGLWNLFRPELTNVQYAPLAELMGRSRIAPEACNCNAPDTGNMEVLADFGTAEQQARWLEPLLAGEIRSGFAMTEPDVASSDATNIRLSIARDGDSYILNGRKWWTTGALHPHCRILIVMGRTDPDAAPHRRQSMVLVPLDTPGVEVVRGLPVFGYHDPGGHAEIAFSDVRVPASNLLANEGDGFLIGQSRLGPGRIHHSMRAIGAAETAWLVDTAGNRKARAEIAAIKVAAANVACRVLDRAIQVHGGAGVSDDFPLASTYAHLRTLRIADGPDEVHKRTIARAELKATTA